MIKDSVLHKLGYKKVVINSRLCYIEPITCTKNLDEILLGLNNTQKFINSKFLYDETGQKLFDSICKLPEYYITRIEIKTMNKLCTYLSRFNNTKLIELGSGNSKKTQLILDVFKTRHKIEYVPIDISDTIKKNMFTLLNKYKNLYITGIIDEYKSTLDLIKHYNTDPSLIFFLGSSFGNFDPTRAKKFLLKINSIMNNNDLFLVGLDLVKDENIMKNAYDDSKSITSKFNLNILSRINTELYADFDITKFKHLVKYNEKKQRIEMYLCSTTDQSVHIKSCTINFKRNELVNTEHSYKYTISGITELIKNSNLKIKNIFQDYICPYALILISK